MTLSALLFAVVGPVLALAVEALNPINKNLIRRNAVQDLIGYETKNHAHMIDDVVAMTASAVEVAGVAPTLVATVTSAFGVINEVSKPLIPLMIYVAIIIVMVLFLLRLLVGQTFVQIDTTRQPFKIAGRERTYRWTGSEMVALLIYAANGLLILVAIGAFCLGSPKEPHA